ncbi:MAG: extracellular solute-binding protein [Candidatus Anammoximicrobium sp.]|nr:extracellular solute-binding protein [Candidatus Anammoximicrobium sp.]
MRQGWFLWRILGLGALSLSFCGCPGTSSPTADQATPAGPVEPLRLVVVDDPGLAEAVQRQWQARAEGALEVRRMTSEEICDPRRKRLAGDAVIYPSGLLGELAERGWISPLSDDVLDSSEFARRDIFDHLRQHEIKWGDQVYAAPLGSPPLMLVYRPDLLDKAGVKPPETWAQYLALSERLAKSADSLRGTPSDSGEWHPVAEPLAPGWASQVLLARAAVYARHRSYFASLFDLDSMEPLIASPPFVRALEELVAAAKYRSPRATEHLPADVWERLRSGQCAVGLTWPSNADTPTSAKTAGPASPIMLAAAELPASADVYDIGNGEWQRRDSAEDGHVTLLSVAGRLGSVVKGSGRAATAMSLLMRLTSAEWSREISPHSPATTLYRTSQLPGVKAWAGESFSADAAMAYAETVQRCFRRQLSLDSVRLPARSRYLAALDEAVHAALRGEHPASECLAAAADEWRKINQDLGIENQRRAYWRSLGKNPP